MKQPFLRMLCLLCAVLLLGTFALTGCGGESAAEDHTDHNHGTETQDDGTTTVTDVAHQHEQPATMGLSYEAAADGTLTLVIKDCTGKLLREEAGLAQKAMATPLTDMVVELCWVTSTNPGGYKCLYINRQTCQVSEMIVGEQASDGNRIVYTTIKDGKLSVTVRDLFNKDGYCLTTAIEDAYTGGAYTVISAMKRENNQVSVSYLTDKEGGRQARTFNLYEKGEKAPNQTTGKTTAKTTKK